MPLFQSLFRSHARLPAAAVIMVIATATSNPACAADQAADSVAYPEGYRNWTHIKSMTLHDSHPLANPFKGLHHVYGNPAAVAGSKNGQFADGATLVFDLLESIDDGQAAVEGKRVLVGVMTKDKRRFSQTGGWGFEGFAGNSKTERLVSDGGASCFGCHTSQQDHGYVFTRWRE